MISVYTIRMMSYASVFALVSACASTITQEPFSCPTPAPPPVHVPDEPPARSDGQALSDPAYFDEMIAHGNNDDLKALLRRAYSTDNYAYANKSQLARVERALAFRQTKGCADVPSYEPNKNYVIHIALGNVI